VVTLPDVDAGPPPGVPAATAHLNAWSLCDAHVLARRLCVHAAVALLVPSPDALMARFPSPTHLSYWASEHLPLDGHQRADALEAPHASARLRLLLAYADRLDTLHCVECGHLWGAADKVMSLQAGEGSAAYVNCHGWVHSLVCLREVNAGALALMSDEPTEQDCWFPGYAWTIALCARCMGHAGWRYTPVGDPTPLGTVPEFWGLRVGTFVQGPTPESESDGQGATERHMDRADDFPDDF
jgi:cereblon